MFENRSGEKVRLRTEPDRSRRFSLTVRDLGVLHDVFLHRAITRRQLQALGHFGSTTVANTRLRVLYDGGLLRRRFVATGAFATEAVYLPGPAAIPEIVASLGIEKAEVQRLARQATPLFLDHALTVVDVRLAFARRKPEWADSCNWLTEPECRHEYEIHRERHILKPDGALQFQAAGASSFCFVEVDRGHASRTRFRQVCLAYQAYVKHGLQERTYGQALDWVLCITTGGDRRIAGLVEAAKNTGTRIAFATLAQVEADPFNAIWTSGHGELFSIVQVRA